MKSQETFLYVREDNIVVSEQTMLLYVRKDSFVVSEQTMLFSPIELKLFLELFRPPDQLNDQ